MITDNEIIAFIAYCLVMTGQYDDVELNHRMNGVKEPWLSIKSMLFWWFIPLSYLFLTRLGGTIHHYIGAAFYVFILLAPLFLMVWILPSKKK